MTLRDATATLIDCARTHGRDEDRPLQRAIKRMEKRLRLLNLRAAKARRRNRRQAWYDALTVFGRNNPQAKRGDNLDVVRHLICSPIEVEGCGFRFNFGSFVQHAELGHPRRLCGRITRLICPECGLLLIGSPPEDSL